MIGKLQSRSQHDSKLGSGDFHEARLWTNPEIEVELAWPMNLMGRVA
jgi:hypothetical protein